MNLWDSLAGLFGGGSDLPPGVSQNLAPPQNTSLINAATTDPGAISFSPAVAQPNVTPDPSGFFTPQNLSKALGVGTGLAGVVNSFRNSPTEAALGKTLKQQQQIAGPAIQQGQAQMTGALTPAQQAQIDQYKQQQLAHYKQMLASAGIPEGSQMADIQAQIDQQALAMSQQFQQQNFSQGIAALGLANNNLAQTANQALVEEAQIGKAHEAGFEAIQQLAAMLGNL